MVYVDPEIGDVHSDAANAVSKLELQSMHTAARTLEEDMLANAAANRNPQEALPQAAWWGCFGRPQQHSRASGIGKKTSSSSTALPQDTHVKQYVGSDR